MRRLMICFIMSALFLGQGFSVAAAICRHGSAREHQIARESGDAGISAGALGEETAASVVAKKGALSGSASLHVTVADLAPAQTLSITGDSSVALPWPTFNSLLIKGEAFAPPLRPPLA